MLCGRCRSAPLRRRQGEVSVTASRAGRVAVPMPAALRLTLWTVFAALWASGCLWLAVHFGLQKPSEFGPIPSPWEAPVLRIHGWLAVAGVFLLGWIGGSHVLDRWTARRNRNSGLMLAGTAAVIVLSGYALYYTTDRLQSVAAAVH